MPFDVLLAGPNIHLPGGGPNYVRSLLENMDESLASFRYVSIGKSSASSPLWRRPFEYSVGIWRFGWAALSTRPDVVHLNPSLGWSSLPVYIILILLARLSGLRVYMFFHGWQVDVANAMIEGTWNGRLVAWALRKADYFSVLCESFREQLIEAGWQPERVVVSSLIVQVDEYQDSGFSEKRAPAADAPLQVLFLSVLDRDKGVWEMMQAVEWLCQAHPANTLSFVIAGDGPELEALREYVQKKDLGSLVQLPGYLRGEEKYEAYQSSHMFVLPSFHGEGFPTVVIEALAAGLPIITTPVGALAEIMGPENGILIESSQLSGKGVGEEIWNLYESPDRRQTMAIANRRLARDYDAEAVCARTADIYRRTAGWV